MTRRRHPLSQAMYNVLDDGNVEVTSKDGEVGIFSPDGIWLDGELSHADPHLCGWLAGPQLPPSLAVLPRFRETAGATEN